MNRKEATSLLVSGLAISGGVLSAYFTLGATTAAPLILSEGLKAFGGLGGGLVANALQKKIIDNHPQDDVLKNGDLTRAIGNAIFKLCGELAKEKRNGEDKDSLEKLSNTELETWENLILGGEYKEGYGLSFSNLDLDEVSAEKSVQYVHAQAANLDDIKALTPQSWQNIIETLCRKQECSLSNSAKEELSDKLHNEFAKTLRHVLTDDFANNKKAYASMQFRILGEVLNYLNEILIYSKQNYEQSEAILAIVIGLSKEVAEINRHSPTNYSPGNAENWEKIIEDFQDVRETLNKTYQNTEETKTDVKEIKTDVKTLLENQKNQLTSKPAKPNGLINVSNAGKTFFTEQGTVLEDLETQLRSRHIACLHGKHGLGKTTNAQEFARRQVGNYDLIVFLNAAEKILETSIINFADDNIPELKSLSLFERQQIAPETKLALFQTFFNDNELWQTEKRGWLLIFDNLESKEQIRKYFPDTNNGDILYTCNDDLYLDEKCEVPIREFSQTEAELFLYKRNIELKDAKHEEIPAEPLADIRKILNDYGRLPFVVNKFRAYLSEIPVSYAAFYQELKNNEQRYFELPASHDKYQYKNEIIAYSTSFEKIKPQENQSNDDQIISRLAVALLEISAFCFPDQIPEEILKDTLFSIVETAETTLSNEILFAEAFRKLRRFDLLNSKIEIFEYLEKRETPEIIYVPFQKKETVYQSHRTIQKIVKLNLENEAKKEILNKIIVVLHDLTPDPELETWKIFEKYLSNAKNLIEEARKLELATEYLSYICNQFGLYQQQIAQYKKAIQFYEETLRIDEKTIDKEHHSYATHLNNLALVYDLQGRYDEAIEKYEEALRIGEKTIGKEHPNYAIRLNNLASVYRTQGRYDEAVEKYEEALRIDEKTVGKEHLNYAIRLNNLGEVNRVQGRYNEAIEKFEKALQINEKTVGKEHPSYASNLSNLALVYRAQGRYDEAIEKFEEALRIDEKTVGKEHPDYAIDLNNLAFIYENQGKYIEALKLYENALRIFEKNLPENHPTIQIVKKNAAGCRMMLEK